jgi:hypothetical protein
MITSGAALTKSERTPAITLATAVAGRSTANRLVGRGAVIRLNLPSRDGCSIRAETSVLDWRERLVTLPLLAAGGPIVAPVNAPAPHCRCVS